MRLNERCDDCREYHEPGPCFPLETERERDEGWRKYRALRLQIFPEKATEEDR